MFSGSERTLLQQRGNMLVMAMFAIVVLSLVGLTMVNLLVSSEKTVVNEVLGERAEQASRAGVELLAYTINPANSSAYARCNTTLNYSRFSNMEGMEGCNVVSRCSTTEFSFSGGIDFHYELKATAICTAGDMTAVKSNTLSMTRRWVRSGSCGLLGLGCLLVPVLDIVI